MAVKLYEIPQKFDSRNFIALKYINMVVNLFNFRKMKQNDGFHFPTGAKVVIPE